MNTTYDYIIVGSGAGGAAAAYRLASVGREVLLVEKGGDLPRDGTTLDFHKVIGQGAFKSKERWLDKDGQAFTPEEYFNLGGKTKWYGAALLRYRPHEFEAEPGFQCLPWPISYDDLAPFYDEAERLLGVRHFDIEPGLRSIIDRIERRNGGWTSEPLPLGLAPEIVEHPEEAAHFDGFASVKGLKSDGQRALLDRVARQQNLHLITGEPVRKLLGNNDAPARVSAVELADGRRYDAHAVLLAAGALHSPRLVQRYLEASGLAARLPSYRLVGRNYKCHLLTAMLAVSPARTTDVVRKTILWLNQTLPHSSIQPLGFDGEVIGSLLPPLAPRFAARAFGERAYGFFLQTEDGSDERNRVIAENMDDAASYPALDYDPARVPGAESEHRRLIGRFRRSLLRAGYLAFSKRIGLAGTAHACGTLVAGKDPHLSVVDENGRVHGMENLYVVDGSVLPRSSRANPSLSIYAWALRVTHLLEIRRRHE